MIDFVRQETNTGQILIESCYCSEKKIRIITTQSLFLRFNILIVKLFDLNIKPYYQQKCCITVSCFNVDSFLNVFIFYIEIECFFVYV